MIKQVTLLLTGSILLLGCYYDKEDALYPGGSCDGVNTAFAANVNPIIQANCATGGCHDASSFNGPGPLTTYTQIRNAATQIKTAVLSRSMPKGATLTAAEIKAISCWVDAGSPNN